MEFLAEYGIFLAKAVTIVIAIIAIIGAIANVGSKNKKEAEGHIEINNLSDEYKEVKDGLLEELLSEEEYKELQKEKKKEEKQAAKEEKKKLKAKKKAASDKKKASSDKNKEEQASVETEAEVEAEPEAEADAGSDLETEQEDEGNQENEDGRLFVLNFDGDVEASAVENLREEITAVIAVADKKDQVLLKLESPGGMVHSYGLAASQLSRIKDAELKLIIAVDEVAASGGYMMACVADEILAAPFAVVGSIGVVAELPNFHRLLKHNKVDYEQHTAGEYKRTLTMFAENSEAARTKFKQELEETHDLFKQFIRDNRSSLDMDKVATGEHWYGTQALELGLIDKIQTSDDFIVHQAQEKEVYEINYEVKKPFAERFSFSIQSAIQKAFQSILQKSFESRVFK